QRAQVQVRKPALAPSVAPFGGEHHKVVGPDRLYLAPRSAPSPGGVEGGSVFDDNAFMAGAERFVQNSLRLLRITGEDARNLELRGDLLEPGGALLQGCVEQVLAVDV